MEIIDRLPVEKVKVCFVCPTCRVVDIKIVKEYEIDPANYPVIKRDGFGNTVYICEAPCRDCQTASNSPFRQKNNGLKVLELEANP